MSAPKMSTLKTSYPKMLTFVTVLELTLDKSGTSSNQTNSSPYKFHFNIIVLWPLMYLVVQVVIAQTKFIKLDSSVYKSSNFSSSTPLHWYSKGYCK